jgi:hypothetical protein
MLEEGSTWAKRRLEKPETIARSANLPKRRMVESLGN